MGLFTRYDPTHLDSMRLNGMVCGTILVRDSLTHVAKHILHSSVNHTHEDDNRKEKS